MKTIKIINGKLITPYRIIENGTLVVAGGKITKVIENKMEPIEKNDEVIDAQGNYVSPGFIDLHVHGGGGADFMDCRVDDFLKVARTHSSYGTTALMPTTLACELKELEDFFIAYQQALQENKDGAQFLGAHLEGPYFNAEQRGAQDLKYIRSPTAYEYKRIIQRFGKFIKRWSVAPELLGSLEMGRLLKESNILPSIAHSNATFEEVVKAFENGYSLITHLYSGMSSVHRKKAFRYAGVVESGFLLEGMDVEIIADGVHLPAPLLELIYKIKGSDRIALVTDAMRAAGENVGESILGSKKSGLPVVVEDGVAKLPSRDSFAGSVATADRLVRSMVNLACIPLPKAIEMVTATPARIVGVDLNKGSLTVGKDADIVIFDPSIVVLRTLIRGRTVYSKGVL